MQKVIILVLIISCVISFAACGNEKGQEYLNAKVLEMTGAEIIVECINESTNQLTGKTLSVSKNVISTSGVPKVEVGDEIRVVFDFSGVKKVSNPVKVEHVYAIYLLDKNGDVIFNM